MRFSTVLLSLGLIFFASSAIAADEEQIAASTPGGELLVNPDADLNALLSPTPGNPSHTGREGVALGVDDGNVCFTMRSYKVKRAERLTDGERAQRSYTTCEMAGNYRLRTAVSNVKAEKK
jgi:hypothetical protein